MRQNKVWVDYKFIQGTAWYLSHDMMIVTTQSTQENPYLFVSGNKEDMTIPCPGVPLLIGSQLDLHFQSLLPTDHVPERGECVRFALSKENFPPLQRKPPKTKRKMENEREKKDPEFNYSKQARCNLETNTFQDEDIRNLPQKQEKRQMSSCPNCQKLVESTEAHFKTSLICKQISHQGLSSKRTMEDNRRKQPLV